MFQPLRVLRKTVRRKAPAVPSAELTPAPERQTPRPAWGAKQAPWLRKLLKVIRFLTRTDLEGRSLRVIFFSTLAIAACEYALGSYVFAGVCAWTSLVTLVFA